MRDYLTPLQAIRHDGAVVLFEDAGALADALGWLGADGTVGDKHFALVGRFGGTVTRAFTAEWVLRDDAGRPIDLDELRAFRRSRAMRRVFHRDAARDHAASLGLPIPWCGTGRGYARFLRSPRTQQELRAASAMEADRDELRLLGVRVKVRRWPPTAWDDIPRCRERGWKRHRARQCRASA